jgi:hypothetical protein
MVRTIASLDFAPLFADGRTPAMITQTLPGEWRTVAPTGAAFKRLFHNWLRRAEKAWGPLPLLWKLEFQARGAPHLHLFLAPPHGEAVCRCSLFCGRPGRPLRFREWLSHSWADVVAHPDLEERARHVRAGTGIDYREGLRARDPKRLAVYFSKHGGAAGGKEYQHEVPQEWRVDGAGPGRFWGYRRLEAVTATVRLDQRDADQAVRLIRRWSARVAFYRPGETYPASVQLRTQRVKVGGRWKRRRRRYLDHGGGPLVGGYVLPNDGPGFVSQLARALDLMREGVT